MDSGKSSRSNFLSDLDNWERSSTFPEIAGFLSIHHLMFWVLSTSGTFSVSGLMTFRASKHICQVYQCVTKVIKHTAKWLPCLCSCLQISKGDAKPIKAKPAITTRSNIFTSCNSDFGIRWSLLIVVKQMSFPLLFTFFLFHVLMLAKYSASIIASVFRCSECASEYFFFLIFAGFGLFFFR